MIIPKKFQIFDRQVAVDAHQYSRLKPLLSGWWRLHPALPLLGGIDLERVIVIELMGRKRPMILERLVGRLTVVSKKRIQEKIQKCLKEK